MSYHRYGMTLAGVVALLAALLASATMWLLLTEPATVADAVAAQSLSPIARELAGLIYEVLGLLLRYL